MPRHLNCPLFIITLTLLALLVVSLAHATALPQGASLLSVTEHPDATPGLFSQLWSLFSVFWSDTGSDLDSDGVNAGPSSNSGTEYNGDTGDTGSGLDPNG